MGSYSAHLDTPGATSFAFDTSANVNKVALSTAAPLTLTTVDGQLATISLAAVETDLGVSNIVAINSTDTSSGTTIDSVQYTLEHCPTVEEHIGSQITAKEH